MLFRSLNKSELLEAYLKGQRCILCAFQIEQPEDIVETPEGYAHRECVEDNIAKYGGDPVDNQNGDSNLEREN